MISAQQLDIAELDALARIAEGRGASISYHVVDRLLHEGLITHAEPVATGHLRLELTPAGLAVIRSSDQ